MAVLWMATFNLENFDETAVGVPPSLTERIAAVAVLSAGLVTAG